MKIVTHNGRFHTDDIFAVATLLLVYPDAEVVRSRNEEVIKSGDIVVDVGFVYDPKAKRFDHHQPEGAGARDIGVPYASFGLVWKKWGREIAGEGEALLIDKKLVCPVDAHDNGISITENKLPEIREYTISDFFYSYLDADETDEKILLEKFLKGVEVAQTLLKREIKIAQEEVSDIKIVRDIFDKSEDKRIIILDKDLSWHQVLIPEPETSFVIYPRKEGVWGVKAVPKKLIGYELKKPFPQSWGGKAGSELAKLTGVEDAVFCHNKLFVCSAKTKEGAMALAKIALNA